MQIYFTKCVVSTNTTDKGEKSKLRNKSVKTKLTYVTAYKHSFPSDLGRLNHMFSTENKTL